MPEDFPQYPCSAQASAALALLLARQDKAFRRADHDLRSPLTALQLAAELLAGIAGPDGSDAAAIASQMEIDVGRMARLLATRARNEVQGARIGLRALLIGDVAALAQPLAARQASLRITCAASDPDCGPPLAPAIALALLQAFCHAAIMVPGSGALMIGADRQDGWSMLDIRICDDHGSRVACGETDALRPALDLLVAAGGGRISACSHADGGGWRIRLADTIAAAGGAP